MSTSEVETSDNERREVDDEENWPPRWWAIPYCCIATPLFLYCVLQKIHYLITR